MRKRFDFRGLFVLDLANNHQGSLTHGEAVIRSVGDVARANGVHAALKFQFRQLDTFVHFAHTETSDNKHIGRFLSTRLSVSDFNHLKDVVEEEGMTSMCTPFDEGSVDDIEEMGIQLIKVASCSANDWPLIERISQTELPVVFSTGGLSLTQIDDVVSLFEHRRVDFGIMHCVSVYPTPLDQLGLNQIQQLKERYRDHIVGFSTHEEPDETVPVAMAVAKGAEMLERHVGLETDEVSLNAYSSNPDQLDAWIKSAIRAKQLCGPQEREPSSEEEAASLRSLRRGIYVRRPWKADHELTRDEVYFAMPCQPGQIHSGQWREGIRLTAPIERDAPLNSDSVSLPSDPEKNVLFTAIHQIKGMLNEARIALNTEFKAEFSHHHGLREFATVGATIIDCINRDYCKKLIIQLPGQHHPAHYHKRKEEAFQVLHGILEMEVEGRRRTLHAGDIQVVQQGVWHEFWTDTGVIFEEVSTTHFNDDSFYEDKTINCMAREERKTIVNHWGRYQI